MLLRNAFSLTTPCLALFLLACNDKGSVQQAQPQAAPSQAAAQQDPPVAQPVTPPTEVAKPSASVPTDTKHIHHHHVIHVAHHVHAAPAMAQNAAASAPTEAAPAAAATLTVPSGTVLTVHLAQELGSKTSNAGDAFTATVAEPIMVDGKTVIPEGSIVSGKVTEATPMGMVHKGVLQVTLNSIHLNGEDQTIQTSTVSELEKGESERAGDSAASAGAVAAPAAGMASSATSMAAPAAGLAGAGRGSSLTGAGAGAGSSLTGAGAAAGAGAGSSLTGAGAGLKNEAEAKVGTVVAAITGSKDLIFPAQAAMKFTLQQNLDVKP